MRQRESFLWLALLGAAGLYWYSRTQQGAALLDSGTESALDFVTVTATRIKNAATSRGYRNNNPGNLRFLSANAWNGQIANDAGYGIYDTPQNGTRALGHQLLAYARRGINTVQGIIYTWAPPTENNTAAYARAVASELGVGVNDVINVAQRLPQLTRAIARHENGYLDSSYDWNWSQLP